MAKTSKKLQSSKPNYRINTAFSRKSKDFDEESQFELELTAENIELVDKLGSPISVSTSGDAGSQRENRPSYERQDGNKRSTQHQQRSVSSSSSPSSSSSSEEEVDTPYYTDPCREQERLTSVPKISEKTPRQIKKQNRYDKYRQEKKIKAQRSSDSRASSQSRSESRNSPSNSEKKQPQIIICVPQAGYPMGYNSMSYMPPHIMAPIQTPYMSAPNGFQTPIPPPHHFFGPMQPMHMAPLMRQMNGPFRGSRFPFRGRQPPRLFHQKRLFQRGMQ